MDGDMGTFVQQQRDAILAKQIINVDWETFEANTIKKIWFPPQDDIVFGQEGFRIVYLMRDMPSQARKVAYINATD